MILPDSNKELRSITCIRQGVRSRARRDYRRACKDYRCENKVHIHRHMGYEHGCTSPSRVDHEHEHSAI